VKPVSFVLESLQDRLICEEDTAVAVRDVGARRPAAHATPLAKPRQRKVKTNAREMAARVIEISSGRGFPKAGSPRAVEGYGSGEIPLLVFQSQQQVL
jgi:hypothetical protein